MDNFKVFGGVGRPPIKRNTFDLSFQRMMSGKFAKLYPVMLQEILPGDSFRVSSEIFIRFMPMIAPVVHRINVYLHWWYVPTRIVWENFKDYIGGGEDGTATNTIPTLDYNYTYRSYWEEGDLPDYMGIPPLDNATSSMSSGLQINALPFRAYQMIWNEFYRDQNVDDIVEFDLGDTASENQALTALQTRRWEKDYFTSALPWTQRGSQSGIPVDLQYSTYTEWSGASTGAMTIDAVTNRVEVDGSDSGHLENLDSTATNIDIIELRKSLKLQEYLERNARIGSRYVEQLQGRWGINLPDYTAQRPVYLGGGKQPVTISEVLNTSDTANADQGNMSGHGISLGAGHGFTKNFLEHGYVLGILSVIPRTAYSQGVHRKWIKADKYDFFTPEFSRIGEQEIYDWELYNALNEEPSTDTFGYQQRYAEYKYNNSEVCGELRSTLNHWQMARQFSSQPTLNSTFVSAYNARTDIFAVDDGSDYLVFNIYHDIKAKRPIPYYSDPVL